MATTTDGRGSPRGPRANRGPRPWSRRALALAVAAALPVLSACGGEAPAGGGRARSLLDAAIAAADAAPSYHIAGSVLTSTAKGEVRVTVESDVERPDRVRSTTTVAGRAIESITVGGNTWIKDARGKWVSNSAPASPAPPADAFALLKGLTGLREPQADSAGGQAAWRIVASAPADAVLRAFPAGGKVAAEATATVTIWLGRGDSRVTRILAALPGAIGFTLDVSFSRFGERFGIAPPK